MKKIMMVLIVILQIGQFAHSQSQAWIPTGSTTTIVGQCTSVQAPSAYTYVGNTGGQLGEISLGTICCDCVGSGNCYPFVGYGYKGCAVDGCNSCQLSASTIGKGAISEGGFVNYSLGIAFANGNVTLPMLNTSIAQFTKIQSAIQAFVNTVYNGKTPPDPIVSGSTLTAPAGYKFALVSVYGRGGMLLIPNSLNPPASEVFFGSITCTCSAGTCTAGSSMGLKYCKGDCTGTCCLSPALVGGGTGVLFPYIMY